MEKYILKFSETGKRDVRMVGGKGANLGELVNAGFPVPPGFSITTAAFELFLERNNLTQYIDKELKGIDIANLAAVKKIAGNIQGLIRGAIMPEDLVSLILGAWRELGVDNLFAVRSSATAEDQLETSFAGQHDSYLNVFGAQQIWVALKNSWASLYNDRAIIYRVKNAIEHSQVKLAVVIQQMVYSDKSGIVFTAEPVTGKRTELVINAGFGLGEALVGGQVMPDIYRVDKKNWSIIERRVGDKQIAIRPAKQASGAFRENLSDDMRWAQVLTDQQIIELAGIAEKIEHHFLGQPQDIEWAIENERLYVVQSRPITGLYPRPHSPLDLDLPRLYFSFNYFQMMADPISPMGQSFIRMVFFRHPKQVSPDDNHYMIPAGGRLFVDLTNLLAFKLFRRNLPGLVSKMLDPIIGEELKLAANREEFHVKRSVTLRWSLIKICWLILPIIMRVIGNIFIWDAKKQKAQMMQAMEQQMTVNAQVLSKATTTLLRLEASSSMIEKITPMLLRYFLHNIASGILSFKILESTLMGMGLDFEVAQLGRGLKGNIVMDMDLAIGDLADLLLANQILAEYIIAHSKESLLVKERLEKIIGGTQFRQALDDFFAKYGFRGQAEIDLARERYCEQQELVIKMILDTLVGKKLNDHRQKQASLANDAETASKNIIKNISLIPVGWLKVFLVKRLIKATRDYLPLREHPKYFLVYHLWLIKKTLVKIAEQLVQDKLIPRANDIYHLTYSEVKELLLSGHQAVSLIQKRKKEYAAYKNLKLPRVITSDGEIIRATRSSSGLPKDALLGVGVSGGIVLGRAKVILDPTTQVLKKGEILVTRFTDPGWTPLFINAIGMVMEVGGIMTHGSIIAREYGLPAVVGVDEATKLIKTGQLIRVNGDLGCVEILE